jgi:hypothetical protein
MSLHKTIIALFVAFAATMSYGCNRPNAPVTGNAEQPASPAGPVVRAVYLYNSEACQCERNRNQEADAILESVLAREQDVLRPEKVDVARNPAELERYERLTKFGFMPVLLGLDAQGRVAKKVEGFFKQAEVEAVLLLIR